MANAHLDENHTPTLTAVLDSTGTSIVAVKANPTNHGLMIDDNNTGSDHGPANAFFDDNHIPVLVAVSSVDGTTPVVVYANSSGKLLVQST